MIKLKFVELFIKHPVIVPVFKCSPLNVNIHLNQACDQINCYAMTTFVLNKVLCTRHVPIHPMRYIIILFAAQQLLYYIIPHNMIQDATLIFVFL